MDFFGLVSRGLIVSKFFSLLLEYFFRDKLIITVYIFRFLASSHTLSVLERLLRKFSNEIHQ